MPDNIAFELIALDMAEFELMSRRGVKISNPLKALDAMNSDMALGFYWGMNYDTAIPETTRDVVERYADAYAAGVLARELIELGGQGDAV